MSFGLRFSKWNETSNETIFFTRPILFCTSARLFSADPPKHSAKKKDIELHICVGGSIKWTSLRCIFHVAFFTPSEKRCCQNGGCCLVYASFARHFHTHLINTVNGTRHTQRMAYAMFSLFHLSAFESRRTVTKQQ